MEEVPVGFPPCGIAVTRLVGAVLKSPGGAFERLPPLVGQMRAVGFRLSIRVSPLPEVGIRLPFLWGEDPRSYHAEFFTSAPLSTVGFCQSRQVR